MTNQGILPLDFAPPALRAHGLCDAHVRPLVGVRLDDDTIRTWRTSPARAWKRPLVEWARTGNSFAALAFDVDDSLALERLAEANMGTADLPVPNVACYRRCTGHAHAVYALARPVHRGEGARPGPLDTLGRASEWLREALRADAGYTGVLVANPVHADYDAVWLRVAAYPLAELTAWIPRGWRRTANPTTDAGRNCFLFRALMQWIGRPANWRADLHEITAYARVLNARLPFGLPDPEVRGIARSVARYHARNMANGQEARFRAIQARRGRLGGRPRVYASNAERQRAYRLRRALRKPKQDSPVQPALILIPKERNMNVTRTRQPWMDDHTFAIAEIGDRFAIPARDHKGMTNHRLALPAMVEAWRTNMMDGQGTTGDIMRERMVTDGDGNIIGWQSTRAMTEILDAWTEAGPEGRDAWVQEARAQIAKLEKEVAA